MHTQHADTRIDEIADGIFRISTRMAHLMPGGFTFNQFLIRDEPPALFDTGPKSSFPAVVAAVQSVQSAGTIRGRRTPDAGTHHHAGAFECEQFCGGLPDPAARASDDGDLFGRAFIGAAFLRRRQSHQ